MDSLSNIDRLLIAQAVWELGTNAWPAVAKILSKHPLLSHPKSFFTAQSCHNMYTMLIEEAGLTLPDPAASIHAMQSLNLAERYYRARFNELFELIATEEKQFKKVSQEIESIRSGAWDASINAELSKFSTLPLPKTKISRKLVPLEQTDKDHTLQTSTPPSVAAEPPSFTVLEDEQTSVPPHPELRSGTEDTKTPPASPGNANGITEPAPPRSPSPIREATPHTEDTEVINVVDIDDSADDKKADSLSPEEAFTPPVTRGRQRKARAETLASSSELNEDAMHVDTTVGRRQGKRKADSENLENLPERKRLKEDLEAVDDDDSGPVSASARSRVGRRTEEQKRFQTVINMVHSQIFTHRNGTVFHNPIKHSEAPDYADIVKRPIDLKTIKARVKDGVITNSMEYERDIYLMFANAMMYNRPGSEIYRMAEEMMHDSQTYIDSYRQTEGQVRYR